MHVKSLVYRIEHGDHVDYDDAGPEQLDFEEFSVSLERNQALFSLKVHYSDVRSAQAAVERFLDAWEVLSGLDHQPRELELVYEDAVIVSRSPEQSDCMIVPVNAAELEFRGMEIGVHVSRKIYPNPPRGFEVTPDVRSMYDRYVRFRLGKENLASMAYFCYTVFVYSVPKGKGQQTKAQKYYGVERDILHNIANLSSRKGGGEARKRDGVNEPYTAKERIWLEAAVKALVRRAGERAADADATLPEITMTALPPL